MEALNEDIKLHRLASWRRLQRAQSAESLCSTGVLCVVGWVEGVVLSLREDTQCCVRVVCCDAISHGVLYERHSFFGVGVSVLSAIPLFFRVSDVARELIDARRVDF